LFAPRLQAEGFTTELALAPDLPPVQGDAQALVQVVINLLQNAYRYSPDEKFVRLAAERRGNEVVITVTDRGIGLTRGQIRRLGRSFERGDDPRVRKLRGTGLGLAIVMHIVAAHRGHLDVRAEPGSGSTFSVRLPVKG
jgi:two-component system phosphate regulon sensor histidine kinase PhoR